MPTVHANGVSLDYQVSGSGEAVVLVHGGFSDYRIWQVHREALGQSYRAIAYSGRYHWPNAPAPDGAGHDMAEHVDDLLALVTTLGAGPAHLVGNSSGGLLCLYGAIRAPELVRSLVLLEPFALPLLVSMPPGPLELFKLAIRHPRTAVVVAHFSARGLGPAQAAFERGDLEGGLRIFARAVLGSYGVDRMTEPRWEQARDNLDVFAAQLTRGSFPAMGPDDVRRIDAPTLLVAGEHSPPVIRLFTDRIYDLLPHAERVEIPGASHDAHVDNPSAVTDAIRAFLVSAKSANPQS
jgi:pimeloyl-ACP methyl ester carboxylesterase